MCNKRNIHDCTCIQWADIQKLEAIMKKGFNKEDGPFVRALDCLSTFSGRHIIMAHL